MIKQLEHFDIMAKFCVRKFDQNSIITYFSRDKYKRYSLYIIRDVETVTITFRGEKHANAFISVKIM
jgi:hypothetical protein